MVPTPVLNNARQLTGYVPVTIPAFRPGYSKVLSDLRATMATRGESKILGSNPYISSIACPIIVPNPGPFGMRAVCV